MFGCWRQMSGGNPVPPCGMLVGTRQQNVFAILQECEVGFYRPLPAASSIRQSKVERRSSLHEESVQMGMVPPPMTLPTALPRRARDKLPV
ncbi:unnamed protein product [Trichobilharzia regenti]|nr:unnamed protein product [Trichobilharzia regenti]